MFEIWERPKITHTYIYRKMKSGVGSGDNFDFQKLHPIPCTLYSGLKDISKNV